MPTIQFDSANHEEIDRPTCRICGARMWMMSCVSRPDKGEECRTFECPVCEISTGHHSDGRGSGASTPV